MIPLIVLLLGAVFGVYYSSLNKEKMRLFQRANDHEQWQPCRDRYMVIRTRIEKLNAAIGLFRFLDIPMVVWLIQDTLELSFPWYIWALAVVGGLCEAYYKLLPYPYRFIRACLVKPKNPMHDKRWIVHVTYSQLKRTFATEYKATHSVYRLALRLFICNVFGHRWNDWEIVKFISGGNSRTCRACLIHHNQDKGVDTYSETHTSEWKRIENPNSVFRRKYIVLKH